MPTQFASLTDPEICRWAAERDGWSVQWTEQGYNTFHWRVFKDGMQHCLAAYESEESAWEWIVDHVWYAASQDAAVALLGRWGYEWSRTQARKGPYVIVYKPGGYPASHDESPTCATARALLNAACELKEAEDAV